MKKMFGIGAVILMILVTIAPVITSMELKTIDECNEKRITKFGDDLVALFIDSLEFKEYKLGNAFYELEYGIWYAKYLEGIFTCKLIVGENTIDTWDVYLDWWTQGGLIKDTHIIKLRSSESPSVDKERLLAGYIASVHIDVWEDPYKSNNVDYSLAKHWRDDITYIPTEPQIEASAPHWYEKIYCVPEIPDLYKLDFFDARVLPNILESKRMGWAGQAAKYLAIIAADIAAILGATVTFLLAVKDDVKIVTQWIVDFIEWFYTVLHGIFYGGLIDLIKDFVTFVLPAVGRILAAAIAWGGAVAVIGRELYKHANAAYNWTLDDPWSKPIVIEGRVDRVEPGEVVTVSCRGQDEEYPDPDGDGTIEYELVVTSEPMGNEKYVWGIHNCLVTVKGSKHDGEAQSIPLLSWACANGSLYWHFVSPNGKTRVRERNIPFFLGKFKSWLRDRPLFTFLEKFLEKIGIPEKTETIVNRDFDLDALVQRAMEEEKQYEPFEGEYKEYYPGAPSDPNIVYYGSEQIIIGFKSYVDVTEMNDVLGYPVVDWLVELNTVIVEIYAIDPEDFIEMAEQLEDVEYAELNYIYQTCFEPNDPLWDDQWGPQAINCPQAWDIQRGMGSKGIAIIDTGVWYDHEDKNVWGWRWKGYDFANNDNDPKDDHGHGTHCAGIASAETNNGMGIAGVADVSIMPIKVLDSGGSGLSSNIAKGVIYAAKDYLVKVISMSLGGYGISTLLHVACDYAYYIKDTLIVAAAGNHGLSRLGYPARFGSVISVGAVNKNLGLCSWSNRGPDLDLVAPGENIISTIRRDRYGELSGTSMATPHVAGVAALYFSADPSSNAVLCKAKLFSTAIPRSGCGHGLVNAYGMVKSRERNRNFQQFSSFPMLQQFFLALRPIINN